MSLMKRQKQARATARTTNERRPAEVAIVVVGSVFSFFGPQDLNLLSTSTMCVC